MLISMTHAGNLDSLSSISDSGRYRVYSVDICDAIALDHVFAEFCPSAVMHLAADSSLGPLDRRAGRGDLRGFFPETFHVDRFREIGVELPFVHDKHSRSKRGVMRGLHISRRPARRASW